MSAVASRADLPARRQQRCPIFSRRKRMAFDRPFAVDALDAATRRRLGDVLHPIFCASYGDLDRRVVCDEIIFRAGGQLALLRGPDGRVLGFGTACVHEIEVDGRTHGVFEGGVYCRPGVRGGKAWGRVSLRIILAERLRHPLRPLHLVAEMLTPVSYRLAHRIFARTYPMPDGETPPGLARLLAATIDARGLVRPTAHPFVVTYPDPARPLRPDEVERSASLQGDPAIDAYLRWNPHYTRGHLLCTITPLGWRDIAAAALRQLFGRRFERTRARRRTDITTDTTRSTPSPQENAR